MAINPVNLQNNHVVEKLCSDELAALRSEVQAGRGDNHLKSLDERGRAQELVRDQYSGRYAFELLQNADDAMARLGWKGQVRFVLSKDALLVANTRQTFGKAEIEAICALGRSSKEASTSIGYKGLGFKSVAEISDEPQVISGNHRFFFSINRLRVEVQKIAGALAATQKLPTYAFPWALTDLGLGDDVEVVRHLEADGFATVIRLPLKRSVARKDVAAAIRNTLSPRQLLFLRNIDAVAFEDLADSNANWYVRARKRRAAALTVVELTTNAQPERWGVFARRAKVDRRLTRPLGAAWAKVEEVAYAVAVQLSTKGLAPVPALDARLHAYFPTEEATGLPFVIHADFALELDRRRVARTRDAIAYNEWICKKIADLTGSTVAPMLAAECGDSPHPTRALLSVDAARGDTGTQLRKLCLAQLSASAWLPRDDGRLCRPSQLALLPGSAASLPATFEFLDEKASKRLLARPIQLADGAGQALTQFVGVTRWVIADVVEHLRQPTRETYRKFWQFLLAWNAQVSGLEKALATKPWLLCVDGKWRAADAGPYLPQQKEIALPDGIPVPVVRMPVTKDSRSKSLLIAMGVKEFNWRELALGTLIPLLKDAKQTTAMRAKALSGLATYLKQQRAGDERVDVAVRQIWLRAATADGNRVVLRRANAVYLGRPFVDHDRLLKIYGPFGEAEFLAEDAAMLHSAAGGDPVKFLTWLGVAMRPRVNAVEAKSAAAKSVNLHDHQRHGELWTRWIKERADAQGGLTCHEGHPNPKLTRSYALDRLPELASCGSFERLGHFWTELALGWNEVYQPVLQAEFACDHGWHHGRRDWLTPSLLAFCLQELAWVPCWRQGLASLERPANVWRNADGQPSRVLREAAVLPAELDTFQTWSMSHRLGLADSNHLTVPHLVRFLQGLQSAFPEPVQDMPADIRDSARWAMRHLNRATVAGPWPDPHTIPLLAKRAGAYLFATDPAVASDPALAALFNDTIALLDADKDQTALAERLGLNDLGKLAKAEPKPRPSDAATAADVQRGIKMALGPILALFRGQIPSNFKEAAGRLQRLAISPCNSLEITYTYKGETRSAGSDAHIFFSTEQVGRVRRRIGTAYVTVDADGPVNLYALGRQLAIYLDSPTLADGFAILLRNPTDHRYLASQHITDVAVAEAWEMLGQPPADEPDPLGEVGRDFWQTAATQNATPTPAPTTGGGQGGLGGAASNSKVPPVVPNLTAGRRPLPAVEHGKVTVRDAAPAQLANKTERPAGRRLAADAMLPGWTDFVAQQVWTTELGHRAEEIVFQNERLRLQALGKDPDLVQLTSRINNSADHDIQSIDDDGQKRYIEVKGTTGTDASAPFDISAAELRIARRERSRYWIYRVLRVDTAAPEIVRFQDPIRMWLDGRARLSVSGANMCFGPQLEEPDIDSA